jgi:hypothetical protein
MPSLMSMKLLLKIGPLHLEDLKFEYLEWAHDANINFILIDWNPKPKMYLDFQKF